MRFCDFISVFHFERQRGNALNQCVVNIANSIIYNTPFNHLIFFSDFPLKLFSPVVAISNGLFSKSVKAPLTSKVESPSPSVSPSHMHVADFTPSLVHRSASHRNSPSSSSSHRSSTNTASSLYRNSSSINGRGSVTSRS